MPLNYRAFFAVVGALPSVVTTGVYRPCPRRHALCRAFAPSRCDADGAARYMLLRVAYEAIGDSGRSPRVISADEAVREYGGFRRRRSLFTYGLSARTDRIRS